MKARVKATGEIVEVNLPYNAPFGNDIYFDAKDNNYPYLLDELDFDFVNEPDYWTRLEHQYAGMAMQGILAKYGIEPLPDDAANDAREYAHALVEKLKEKEERK